MFIYRTLAPRGRVLHPERLLQASNRNIAAQRSSYSRLAKKHIFILVSTRVFSARPWVSSAAADWQSSQVIIWSGFGVEEAKTLPPHRLRCRMLAATLADNLCVKREREDELILP